MSYKVKSIEVFEQQAKRLSKKYPSLKNELLQLVSDLKINPDQGTSLGKAVIKYGWLLLQKVKEKVEELESLPML